MARNIIKFTEFDRIRDTTHYVLCLSLDWKCGVWTWSRVPLASDTIQYIYMAVLSYIYIPVHTVYKLHLPPD